MHADKTVAGRTSDGRGRRRSLWKSPALITALILLIPLLGNHFATALAQALVLAVALILLVTRNPQLTSWTPPELRGFGGNAFFMLFAGSAVLFRKAGHGESAPGAV